MSRHGQPPSGDLPARGAAVGATPAIVPRDVVDYALRRRRALRDLATGRGSALEACDAHPYLKMAARHYGEPSPAGCPVCRKRELFDVHYVYGDALGPAAGQAKARGELPRLAAHVAEFSVYVVEVCLNCGWNHLIRAFTLGDAEAAAAPSSNKARR